MSAGDDAVQPFLADLTAIVRAPTQVWSGSSGAIGDNPIDGLYFSDVRIVSACSVTVDGRAAEPIAVVSRSADAVEHVGVLRFLDDRGADPKVRLLHRRVARTDGVDESVVIESGLEHPISVQLLVFVASDMASMDAVKHGDRGTPAAMRSDTSGASWSSGDVSVHLHAADCDSVELHEGGLLLAWRLEVPARGSADAAWTVRATDAAAVVVAAAKPVDWNSPTAHTGDDRLDRWLARALDDLGALRMSTADDPRHVFLAAGAPWFFTLFGRDSIWAARFLLPLGGSLASDTLAILGRLQGDRVDPETAEQPGKIMHELRRTGARVEGSALPPLYYGTIDATPLWVCLLCDLADAGGTDAELAPFRPHLEQALAWMRDFGDSDGDGLLEYIDESGRGLANQGWKDSGDSVQWADGRLAEGPIALCEVQAYAFEAATRGAVLLERLGGDGTPWRQWADALRTRFNETFWIDDPDGAYPAIALDGSKRAVTGVTSNIGHLLGTGLLDARQSALVAARLVSPAMASGFGLRTMATSSAGYWPLSYHGGSVWAHDTAIAIRGLGAEGFAAEAAELAEGLLRAAADFDYRMPELHSGDSGAEHATAVPYPAACRPQAWSAAAAIAVRDALARGRN